MNEIPSPADKEYQELLTRQATKIARELPTDDPKIMKAAEIIGNLCVKAEKKVLDPYLED